LDYIIFSVLAKDCEQFRRKHRIHHLTAVVLEWNVLACAFLMRSLYRSVSF